MPVARSGRGTLAKFTTPDDNTLVLTFDAPAPLTADRIAMWVNGTVRNGPKWMAPSHYAKQFHPKYNKDVPKDWASAGGLFETKVYWSRNPMCPTMTGWKLESLQEGRLTTLERNPYYYDAVMPNGDQLPYADTVKVLLWDGGSGTGSIFFLNYDHKDEKFRKLVREPKFRQALSLGVDRKEIQKAIYFNTGEITTGTMSPKAIEFHVDDKGKQVYKNWRDAYVKHDPEASATPSSRTCRRRRTSGRVASRTRGSTRPRRSTTPRRTTGKTPASTDSLARQVL
ncbi:ABC transporter substrate-binding protein [Actinopolymorpha rutila]|uniref:ABC-type transport system substrate-binding protein n=1 Tax=Actinopolymorpha rutila TaxID=446787 RepID=A0A852ZTV6_9ACTN|nr:ABC transporter substrate-binding protein [Actinopolymorpha rutila]NYH92430.1 ABC-type transport system substrate-binding protein [Actinopolymorpha rutila]